MRMRIQLNKYEKGLIKTRAQERGVKPWELMREISNFANEEVFKRFFEKDYKAKEENVNK